MGVFDGFKVKKQYLFYDHILINMTVFIMGVKVKNPLNLRRLVWFWGLCGRVSDGL